MKPAWWDRWQQALREGDTPAPHERTVATLAGVAAAVAFGAALGLLVVQRLRPGHAFLDELTSPIAALILLALISAATWLSSEQRGTHAG